MSAMMTISNLSAEAAKLASEAGEIQKEFQQKTADLKARYPWANFDEFDLGGSTDGGTVTTTELLKRRGRPKTSASNLSPTATVTTTASKKRGRPKGSKNKKSSGKVKPSERNYDNKISLREAIWQILDMGPNDWSKHLPDLPEEAEGLKAAEIRDIIEITKIWQSSSDNIDPQVQQHLHKLRAEEKIARGDDRRYYIVEGAELKNEE